MPVLTKATTDGTSINVTVEMVCGVLDAVARMGNDRIGERLSKLDAPVVVLGTTRTHKVGRLSLTAEDAALVATAIANARAEYLKTPNGRLEIRDRLVMNTHIAQDAADARAERTLETSVAGSDYNANLEAAKAALASFDADNADVLALVAQSKEESAIRGEKW